MVSQKMENEKKLHIGIHCSHGHTQIHVGNMLLPWTFHSMKMCMRIIWEEIILQNLLLYWSPRLLCEVLKSKNVVYVPNYNVINSYSPFLIYFSITTLLQLGVYFRFDIRRKWKERKKEKKNLSPNVGLEPTTLRLRVSCSTDWASRANLYHGFLANVFSANETKKIDWANKRKSNA